MKSLTLCSASCGPLSPTATVTSYSNSFLWFLSTQISQDSDPLRLNKPVISDVGCEDFTSLSMKILCIIYYML